jgi:hypothetical protein
MHLLAQGFADPPIVGIYTDQVLDSYKGKNRLEVRYKLAYTCFATNESRYLPMSSPLPNRPTTT